MRRVSDVNMEEGSLRCDANISLRPRGREKFGTKAEVKNMNSFRSVVRALHYEIDRMRDCVARGEPITQETRGWDEVRGLTHSMRSKEQAHDYRYFPDPDLVSLSIDAMSLEQWQGQLPELPTAKRQRFINDYGLSAYDADILTEDSSTAGFFEAVAHASGDAKQAANWIMGDVRRVLQAHDMTLAVSPMKEWQLADLIAMVRSGDLTGKAAKEVCEVMVTQGVDPRKIVQERSLSQVTDTDAIRVMVDSVIAKNEESAATFRSGKEKALDFLIGQIMRESRGKANIEMVRAILKERLKA